MDKNVELPLVSVIMPVYNAEKYLPEAIESILNQTYTNFEFLIFDDASTDKSFSIIENYALEDRRIICTKSKQNMGYVKHLNQGIKMAKGKYIARMDADDISCKRRLEKQIDFIECHLDVGVCGSWYKPLINRKEVNIAKLPTNHDDIIARLLWASPFAHPTIMMRKNILDKFNYLYNEAYLPAEDYDLWVRLSAVTKFANLPEPLLIYRIHEGQVSRQKLKLAFELRKKIILELVELQLKEALSQNEWIRFQLLWGREYNLNMKEFDEGIDLQSKLLEYNKTECKLNPAMLSERLTYTLVENTLGSNNVSVQKIFFLLQKLKLKDLIVSFSRIIQHKISMTINSSNVLYAIKSIIRN